MNSRLLNKKAWIAVVVSVVLVFIAAVLLNRLLVIPNLRYSNVDPNEKGVQQTADGLAYYKISLLETNGTYRENPDIYVLEYKGNETDITIKTAYDGMNVVLIGGAFLYENQDVISVDIPKSVEKLDGALSLCKNLKKVIIRNPDVVIDNYFLDGSPNAVIYAAEGSTAQQYANEHNIPFELL